MSLLRLSLLASVRSSCLCLGVGGGEYDLDPRVGEGLLGGGVEDFCKGVRVAFLLDEVFIS